MPTKSRNFLISLVTVIVVLSTGATLALGAPGYVVSLSEDGSRTIPSSMVILRNQDRISLSIQPLEAIGQSWVVVVPASVTTDNIHPVSAKTLEDVTSLASPRLVERWEQDPCTSATKQTNGTTHGERRSAKQQPSTTSPAKSAQNTPSKTTEKARVPESKKTETPKTEEPTPLPYNIKVLGPNSGVIPWLQSIRQSVSASYWEGLRKHVQAGRKLLVLTPKEGETPAKTPFQLRYTSSKAELFRQKDASADDTTIKLLLHILAKEQRFDIGNQPNATLPTNIFVHPMSVELFNAFYRSIFQATAKTSNNAFITEYAHQLKDCPGCEQRALDSSDIASLGGNYVFSKPETSSAIAISDITLNHSEHKGGGPVSAESLSVALGFLQEDAVLTCLTDTSSLSSHDLETLQIGFAITPEGKVSSVRSMPTMDNHSRKCIADILGKLQLPVPKQHSSIVMTYWNVELGEKAAPAFAQLIHSLVLTRLHAELPAAQLDTMLTLRDAAPIAGGLTSNGTLDKGAVFAQRNQFSARYIHRHPWDGKVNCDQPVRGQWGPQPAGSPYLVHGIKASTWTATAAPDLRELVAEDIAQIGLLATNPATYSSQDASETDGSPTPTSATDDSGDEPTTEGSVATQATQGGVEQAGAKQPQAVAEKPESGLTTTKVIGEKSNDGGTTASAKQASSSGNKPMEHIPWSGQERRDCSQVPIRTTWWQALIVMVVFARMRWRR